MRIHMQSITRVLGPQLRYALWVQGCHLRCKGCVAQNTQDFLGGYEVSVEDLYIDIMKYPEIEGITISGGEPFEQASDLLQLIAKIKNIRDFGVIVYTGYLLEELKEKAKTNHDVHEFMHHIDLLIDGPYIQELDDQLSLRGSSNQRIICLTNRYESIIQDHYGLMGRKVEFEVSQNEYKMIGIPTKETIKIMNIIKNGKGDINNEPK